MRAALMALALLTALPAWAGEMRPFVAGSWAQMLAGHAGRPLAVHFWSLSCAPCLAELPDWAALQRQRGIDVVFVSTDPIEESPRLQAMLARHGLGDAESWAFADPFAERLRFEIDRRWRGELPLTRLVAPDGKAESHVGSFAHSGLKDRMEALRHGGK